MIKITKKMLDESRTKKGSFTADQAKIMLGIYGKGWVKKLLACNEFCPAIWEKFKSLNVTHKEIYESKNKSNANGKVKDLNSLDTGKFNCISYKMEGIEDDIKDLLKKRELFKELRDSAGEFCVDIYNDSSLEEVKELSPAILGAWTIGRLINKNLNLIDKASTTN